MIANSAAVSFTTLPWASNLTLELANSLTSNYFATADQVQTIRMPLNYDPGLIYENGLTEIPRSDYRNQPVKCIAK